MNSETKPKSAKGLKRPGTTGRKLPCGRAAPSAAGLSAQADRTWRERLQEHLKVAGLRTSDQRMQIAELIVSLDEHLSAPEIVDRVRKTHPAIGPATVYRNIRTLCEARVLKESLNDAEGRTVYERFPGNHHDH